MTLSHRSSTTRKHLSICWLTAGLACLLSNGMSAATQVDELQLDTFSRVTDLSEFPYFKEAYHYPLQTGVVTTPADEILVLKNFFTLSDLISHGEDLDDLDDDEYEYLNLAEYTSYAERVADRPEKGYFGFKFASDDVPVDTSQAVGFIRKSRHLDNVPSEKLDGLFEGAVAAIEWESMDYNRVMQSVLEYEINGTLFSRTIEDIGYSVFSNSVTIGSMSFPVTDELDSVDWVLGSVNLRYGGEGEFYGLIRRNDYLTKEDLEGIIPETVDPEFLWNQLYVARFLSPHDADRDHVPDLLDQTQSLPAYPWYADIATYTDWYWAHWLGFWVYSDRLSEWDYWQNFGWTYVSESSSRDSFWFHAPSVSPGWLVSSDSWYPTVYDTTSESFVYFVVINDSMGYVYSYADGSWKAVNP